jgi:hypothetical protein
MLTRSLMVLSLSLPLYAAAGVYQGGPDLGQIYQQGEQIRTLRAQQELIAAQTAAIRARAVRRSSEASDASSSRHAGGRRRALVPIRVLVGIEFELFGGDLLQLRSAQWRHSFTPLVHRGPLDTEHRSHLRSGAEVIYDQFR